MAELTLAAAVACANLAMIKYWGNRDEMLRLPANGSISMNLAGMETHTQVAWEESGQDCLILNGVAVGGAMLARTSEFLNLIRGIAGIQNPARVESSNNFPTAAGIASSASAFAALALAATRAAGLVLDEAELSRLARRGSGSACRSIPGGFVEWKMGATEQESFAISIAPPDHWLLKDCIALVSTERKAVGSTEGHARAASSPIQAPRLADAPRRLEVCRNAILHRDFAMLAGIVELDSNWMHAVMMTSTPPLIYWQAGTLEVIQAVHAAREQGLPACCSIDAGPNVHVLCEARAADEVLHLLQSLPGVQQVLLSGIGGPARLDGPPGMGIR
jgi:diphosphomevalonate decarboxylase